MHMPPLAFSPPLEEASQITFFLSPTHSWYVFSGLNPLPSLYHHTHLDFLLSVYLSLRWTFNPVKVLAPQMLSFQCQSEFWKSKQSSAWDTLLLLLTTIAKSWRVLRKWDTLWSGLPHFITTLDFIRRLVIYIYIYI